MKLTELMQSAGLDEGQVRRHAPAGNASSVFVAGPGPDPEILAITDDSRAVDGATLFTGTQQGLPYVRRLLENASTVAAVLLPLECQHDPEFESLFNASTAPVVLFSDDVSLVQGLLASALYGHPSREIQLVGVTGTNGKTTVTRMLYQIWRGLGEAAGVIGTLGALWETGPHERSGAPANANATSTKTEIQTGYTTPRAPVLQELLRRMTDDGVRYIALEVSSEALALRRLAGTRFAAAAFTNLSVDHLDFHGDLEQYYQAKRQLFHMTAQSGGALVLTTEAEHGARLAREFAEYPHCIRLDEPFITRLPAPTRFNQWNASLACLVAEQIRQPDSQATPAESAVESTESHVSRETITEILAHHEGIPGRFYRVPSTPDDDPNLYGIVDYAHTPDALENTLRESRALNARTLVCVFGCGGDRDRGKRPLMGEIAARLADIVIVCDDNPRSEDPAPIRAEIMSGARDVLSESRSQIDSQLRSSLKRAFGPEERLQEIGDRRAAIRKAVALARVAPQPTIVVVAGKGHEDYQILAGGRVDFSDVAELEAAFQSALNEAEDTTRA